MGNRKYKKMGHYNEEDKQKYISSVKNEIFGNKNIIIKPKENILKEILMKKKKNKYILIIFIILKKQELENIKKETNVFVANLPKKKRNY